MGEVWSHHPKYMPVCPSCGQDEWYEAFDAALKSRGFGDEHAVDGKVNCGKCGRPFRVRVVVETEVKYATWPCDPDDDASEAEETPESREKKGFPTGP